MINIIKRYAKTETILMFVGWFIAVVLIGMFDLVEMEFTWERVFTPSYWNEVVTLIIAGIVIFAMTLYRRYYLLYMEDTDSMKREEMIEEALTKTGTRGLTEFVYQKNIERRKEAYLAKISEKFQNKLTKMTKYHPQSLDIWLHGTEEQRQQDKHCIVLRRYQELMDEEYLEKNKHNLPVRFTKLTPNFIQSGVNTTANNDVLENPSKPVKMTAKDNWINFTGPVVTTSVIIAMIISAADAVGLLLLFTIALKLFLLFIQRLSAIIYSGTCYRKTRIADLSFRYRLCEEYVSYKKEAKDNANGLETKIHSGHTETNDDHDRTESND